MHAKQSTCTGTNSSDCDCNSHLFRLEHDPLEDERFLAVIEWFRMERPVTRVRAWANRDFDT